LKNLKNRKKIMAKNILQEISDRIIEAVEQSEDIGFCTGCGTEHESIEPDARHYKCEKCGQNKVFGAEELLLYI
jgi:predicted RNA-binding Zn-ribbon protein involved in translation (DUF1610 family)